MSKKKFNKCPACGGEKKYPIWVRRGSKNIKLMICKNGCEGESRWQ